MEFWYLILDLSKFSDTFRRKKKCWLVTSRPQPRSGTWSSTGPCWRWFSRLSIEEICGGSPFQQIQADVWKFHSLLEWSTGFIDWFLLTGSLTLQLYCWNRAMDSLRELWPANGAQCNLAIHMAMSPDGTGTPRYCCWSMDLYSPQDGK